MRVLSPPTQITMMLRAYYEDRRWPRDPPQLHCEAGYSPPRAPLVLTATPDSPSLPNPNQALPSRVNQSPLLPIKTLSQPISSLE